ncbi:DoxX family protein [Flammeovirga kamogawensis]|uniref:DoxX family protein n=1 Tax=Flammeovirga kamogawensis TaxID=373891 RepID=A0ABX8GYI7_9BACT|nr:DoxX family protein [Flammeovirga kamogawensis]MBB6460918.1 hypothetical protein [Flammeovirga kamogawensis]QWG08262.1 DoxX family protein [Flammeovirga kamogawensis]TRX70065.1 DoxX family protein [Flammeovirga kamogawensis]
MEKSNKIIYYGSTGLLSVMMLMSAGMYFVKHEEIASVFTNLGYPSYIIYPLAIAKIAGLIAIWSRKSNLLKEWAYAGFFFDFVLAAAAHISISDGEQFGAIIAAVLLLVSRFYEYKVYST